MLPRCLILLLLPLSVGHACPNLTDIRPGVVTEPVRISTVTDGDTVKLTDGRRVRLIGFNTHELQDRDANGQRMAREARLNLQHLLESVQNQAILWPGPDAQDRNGRLLAHLQLPDGRWVSTEMIRRGLAAESAVAPNTACAEHFLELEREARAEQRGLWAEPDYAGWLQESTPGAMPLRGFAFYRGKVTAVHTRGFLIDDRVHVSSRERSLNRDEREALLGRSVEVRGWFSGPSGQERLRLHHRANLAMIDSHHRGLWQQLRHWLGAKAE